MPKQKPNDRKFRSFGRTLKSYERHPGNRSPGRCILIVCEGAETEPNYFESLREYLKLSTVQVKIKDRAGAPIGIINEAQAQVQAREHESLEHRSPGLSYEAIWCVFDVENPNYNQTFERAVQAADKNGYHLAISNPAFEFWYVLHFEHTARPFMDGSELKEYLRRHIPGYFPAMKVFAQLINSTNLAIRNAKNLLENHPQYEQRFPNPSTSVHILVEEMIQMSPSGREHFK